MVHAAGWVELGVSDWNRVGYNVLPADDDEEALKDRERCDIVLVNGPRLTRCRNALSSHDGLLDIGDLSSRPFRLTSVIRTGFRY